MRLGHIPSAGGNDVIVDIKRWKFSIGSDDFNERGCVESDRKFKGKKTKGR